VSTLSQRSFAGGELSPRLYARCDTIKYATGVRTLRNFYVMRDGGASNRQGTEFICEVNDSTKAVRLIPFIYNASTSSTYPLEFGDSYMRVIKSGHLQNESAKVIVGITLAAQAVVNVTSHGYSTDDQVYLDLLGMTELSGRTVKVETVDADHFKIKYLDGTYVDSTAFSAFTSGTSQRFYKISTPYAAGDLSNLRYAQSSDVMTIAHGTYAPRELQRTGDINWTFSTISFVPTISTPTSLSASGTGVVGYKVTAVDAVTGEESLPTAEEQGGTKPTATSIVNLSWDRVPSAGSYNVYRAWLANGTGYGFVTSVGQVPSGLVHFFDDGTLPAGNENFDELPPTDRLLFQSAGNYPHAVAYFQQRLCFAATNNDIEKGWCSRSGIPKSFTLSTPLTDDSSIAYTLAGKQKNEIKHLLDLGEPLVFTDAEEISLRGNGEGVLTPTAINPKRHSYNGCSALAPLVVDASAVYLQARGSIVRDLAFDLQVDGYRGNDLTVFSSHLVDKKQIVDWAYQKTPHSVLWMVRNDGVLLSLTYVREQQILAWAHHDTDGLVENVCVVPEGTEDRVYLVVKRTIGGRTVRYIERMASRSFTDMKNAIFMDAAKTVDGTNTGSTTMTVSGGTTWGPGESLTLTASGSSFSSTDLGNEIQLTGSDGTFVRFTIQNYSSATVVTGFVDKDLPIGMQSAALTTWAKGVKTVTGAWHLEGKEISILGDGNVVASPNNSDYDVVTVTNGAFTLSRPYAVIQYGLPFICDLETLDIDTPNQETFADKKLLVRAVTIHTDTSRGGFVGGEEPSSNDVLDGLTELKSRTDADPGEGAVPYLEEKQVVKIESHWNSNGRIFIRQVDPLPLSILAVHPDVAKG
jgi:hypothetical protein